MSSKILSRSAFATLFFLLISLPAFSDSHVRIVRLSYIEGGVQIDRNTGQYEKAILNLPITEGTKLRTGSDGRAEVEFEDGSTIRLASNTTVQFPQLSLQESGTKVSAVELTRGTLYANSAGNKNELALKFGRGKLELTRPARLRIDASDNRDAVAVFKGDVQVDGAAGKVEIKKNETADFDADSNSPATVAKKIDREPLDNWDKQQSEYHTVYANNSINSLSPYPYGSCDLNYYGMFFSAPGYGMLWQPYLIGAGWDPFMDGAWAFTPGWGYGWISAYPWGWIPYHYGSWVFLPAYGWAWQPGGAWMPVYSQPVILKPPTGFKPPQAPITSASTSNTIVTVNRRPVSAFAASSGSKILIRNDSAGLGVPRGQVTNLATISHSVQQKGAVSEHIHSNIAKPSFDSQMGSREIISVREPARGAGSAPVPVSAREPVSARGPMSRSEEPRMSAPAPTYAPPPASAPAASAAPMPAPHASGGSGPHR